MCGIVGFIHSNSNIKEKDLREMTQTISYRGPDDEGYFYTSTNGHTIGMGFRRLAILDLSLNGHQPMHFEHLVITFNGEVYNFKDVREELIAKGYMFGSNSDTEVILKAFHCWGPTMVNRFIGMFAIAIYNKKNDELFLFRDRIGIKPLYYYLSSNSLVYASELKPIMRYPGFNKEIDFQALSSFLYHGYITGERSIFQNVYKLEPGTYMRYANGQISKTTYWSVKEKYLENSKSPLKDEAECLQIFDDLLTSSVKYRMISDVPVGCFLSGGFDSSLVSAVMQKLSPQPISTFTIGFNEEKFNEALCAKEVSRHLGTNHHELYLSVSKAKELIEEIPAYYDEPFGDNSALPSMLVSRLAKDKVTVVLSGDGGDELFCGYKNYNAAAKLASMQFATKPLGYLQNVFDISHLLYKINHRFGRYPYLNSPENIVNVNYILSKYALESIFLNSEYFLNKAYTQTKGLTSDVQELYMLQDMKTYLPDDILTKMDRASMSISLEARVPILDHRIIEFSYRVPHHLKNNNGVQKYLLKQLAYKYIPKALLDRPKQGFAIPIFKWMREDMHYLIDELLNERYLKDQGIFNYMAIRNLLNGFQHKKSPVAGNYLWNVLSFQLWYNKYMK
jgi:asparagine synthase (glutamine-hydrolysing)